MQPNINHHANPVQRPTSGAPTAASVAADAATTIVQKAKQQRAGRNGKGRKVLVALLIVLLVAAVGVATVFYIQYQDVKNHPEKVTADQTKQLTDKIGALMVLPSDEQPTIATVEDKNKLKDEPFFSKAENGDKLLIYSNAKQAIIYRPSTNKVINVGPIAISGQSANNTAATSSDTNAQKK